MITTRTQVKYLQWLSADEMNEESKKWISELNFIHDEHLFFKDMIKTYTLYLIHSKSFSENKDIVDALSLSEKRTNALITTVKNHKNNLEVLLDGINDIENEAKVKDEHKDLILKVSDLFADYKLLKTKLFRIIKEILKSQKLMLPK